MATATTKSKFQKRGVPNLSKLFIDTPPLQLSCNTTNQQRKPNDEDNDSKLKTSHKSQKALQLAQLINRNPWSEDLQSSLSSLYPSLSKTTVLQTLRRIKTPSKSLQFFNWVSSLSNPNGFPHDNQIYLTMLEILGRARRLNAARNLLFSIPKRSGNSVQLDDRLFNSLIRSYGRAGLFNESVKVFTTMKSMGVSPSVFTFNNLLSILLCRGRTGMAQQLFDEMLKTYGVMPDVFTFNILIRGFCMSSMTDEGFRFFNEMSRFQCDPDVVTYNTLVDGLCRAGKVKNARNLVKGMCTKREELSPNAVTYTTLIRGYCVRKEIAEALDVFEEMLDRGLNPNKITYNTLIQGLCEAKRFDKIKELFKGARGCGEFAPDTCTFNTLMSAHCNAGKLEEAIVVFKKMADFQVHPDSASYSILIRGLCAKGLFEKAEELFDELAEKEILLRDEGCEPLAAAYNPMFEHLCANGKTKKAEKIFRQLMKRGTHDPPSYKTLIMGHCMESTFLDGYNLLLLMLRRDFVPDFETYQSLIEGILQKGYPVLAHRTLEMMLKSSHLPKGSTFHSILSELVKKLNARESANFITLMVERKIRQNINLSTGAVILLFKSGLRDKALKVLSLLYENGYSVQMDELVSFLCHRRKLLDARTVLLFSLEKHGKVDTCMCETVITVLCKMGKNSEAFGLFYELVEKGIRLQLDSLENLKLSLESDGKSKEAEFVSKRMPKGSL